MPTKTPPSQIASRRKRGAEKVIALGKKNKRLKRGKSGMITLQIMARVYDVRTQNYRFVPGWQVRLQIDPKDLLDVETAVQLGVTAWTRGQLGWSGNHPHLICRKCLQPF